MLIQTLKPDWLSWLSTINGLLGEMKDGAEPGSETGAIERSPQQQTNRAFQPVIEKRTEKVSCRVRNEQKQRKERRHPQPLETRREDRRHRNRSDKRPEPFAGSPLQREVRQHPPKPVAEERPAEER